MINMNFDTLFIFISLALRLRELTAADALPRGGLPELCAHLRGASRGSHAAEHGTEVGPGAPEALRLLLPGCERLSMDILHIYYIIIYIIIYIYIYLYLYKTYLVCKLYCLPMARPLHGA